jgi:hypothetical protein
VAFLVSIGASKLPLTTQNPCQSGPRTHGSGVSAPVGLRLQSQLQQRARKARPFERLLSAPSPAHSDLFIRQPCYL